MIDIDKEDLFNEIFGFIISEFPDLDGFGDIVNSKVELFVKKISKKY